MAETIYVDGELPAGPPDNQGSSVGFGIPAAITRAGQQIASFASKTGITNLPSQVLSRLNGKILPGGISTTARTDAPSMPKVSESDDWRVRLSLPRNASILYNDPRNTLLLPLQATYGVVFPLTPSVTGVTHTANWEANRITHSNYPALFYQASEVNDINISGEFPAQTVKDAEYVMAAIQFFRASTKMFFGNSDPYTGNPPPILILNGYGRGGFNKVPIVVKSVMIDYPDDVDYIPMADGTRIATLTKITIVVQPIYSRKKVASFSHSAYSGIQEGFL